MYSHLKVIVDLDTILEEDMDEEYYMFADGGIIFIFVNHCLIMDSPSWMLIL